MTIVLRLVMGAAAGLVATFVMDRVTTALYAAEGDDARRREDKARGGETAYAIAAGKRRGISRATRSTRGRASAWGRCCTGARARRWAWCTP